MRYQGRITEWKDDRGFGFITPNGGGAKVFVHFRSVRKGEPRPAGNELVTYELAPADAKGPRAADVAHVERVRVEPRKRTETAREGNGFVSLITAAILIAMAVFTWNRFSARRDGIQNVAPPQEATSPLTSPKQSTIAEQFAPSTTSSAFKCEGKQHCSQMSSCEEAKFYFKNCPNVKIDGDGDGLPCERGPC